MKLLITGGAGFMGSNFIRHLLHTYPEYHIVNLDKLTYAGNPANLIDIEKDFPDRYRFIKGDIASRADVERAAAGVDVIVNYAAETHVDRSIMDPAAFLQTDVMGTYQLLEYVREHGVQRMIQISTDEVFGSIPDGEFHEQSPFEPNSPYAASKAGGDLLCRAYAVTYHTPVIVTHSCNFYGPYQYPEKIIPLFITNVLEGKKVPVYGAGKQVREWIFTEDHCSAIDAVLHRGVIGEVYNIGSGYRLENIELTRRILALLGSTEDQIEYVTDRPAHDVRYAVKADKLKALGWQPAVSFDAGLARTIDWYRSNESWWRTLKSGDFLEYYRKQYNGSV